MSVKRFSDGELVYAKWPGSALYYKGNIIEFNPVKNTCKLKFESDDSEIVISTKDIVKESVFGRSRSKSPARRKRSRSGSPSRRRRQSKSPARKQSTSPQARKSPTSPRGRKPSSPARVITQALIAASKSASVNLKRVSSEKSAVLSTEEVVKNIADSTVETISHTPKEEVRSHLDTYQSSIVSRSATRSIQREEQTVTRRVSTRSVTRAQHEQAQVETIEEKGSKTGLWSKINCTLHCTLSAVGYTTMMIIPLLLIYGLYLVCKGGKKSKACTFFKRPVIPAMSKFFSWKSVGYVFGWFFFQAILSILPIGKVVAGPILPNRSKLQYRLNGLPALIISLITFGSLVYFGKFPTKFISLNYLSLVTASFLYALLVSLVVVILSRCNAARHEPSGGILKDFALGRIFNPRLFAGILDVKTYAFKAGFITWGILNLCYVYNMWENDTVKTNFSLVLVTMFQMWYILDLVVFEESLLYSASLSSEKVGYMSFIGMFTFFPFFSTAQVRYLVWHPVSFKWYCYVIPVFMQVIGYFIYRSSKLQKFNFRKDSHKAKLSGVDYITTTKSKDILIDGWWARLRHPNYFGDLMMCCSWATVCGFYHFLPWVWPVFLLVTLFAMAKRDDTKCKEKYGLSWQEYQDKVKHRFIPFIY